MFSPLQQIPLFAFAPKSIRRSKAPPKQKEIGKRNILFGQNTRKQGKETYCSAKTQGNRQKKTYCSTKTQGNRQKKHIVWPKHNERGKRKLLFNLKTRIQAKETYCSTKTQRNRQKKHIVQPKHLEKDKKNISVKTTRNGQIRKKMHLSVKM